MTLPIVHHPGYDAKLPPTHRFPMSKYSLLMESLGARDMLGGAIEVPSPAAPEWLNRAHDSGYVEQVLTCTVPHRIEREIGFPVDERVSRRAQLASAGTALAARLALQQGIACNAAGGSHHARRSQGAGFCTLNDVGVAAALLLAEGLAERILVVDLDVHQGDGTADIFAEEPRVFTFSMHGERNYPVRKIASDLDIGLADGIEDAAYLETLRAALPTVTARSAPDIVFYNAGVDPHFADRLGRMKLTDDGLRERDRTVIGYFRDRDIPVCGVIGGGYSTDVASLAERHAILFEVAAEFSAGG
jgi:acetoin utilization deacetylase AcuC-like enzyme